MKITALVENTRISKQYKSKHGLSLYIQTKNHNILFDMGPNNLFINNALKCGLDIAEVDTVILSHGHIDHGGGINNLLEYNKKANVYVQEFSLNEYYTKFLGIPINIGIPNIKQKDRLIYTSNQLKIDDELFLFSDITGQENVPTSNKLLYKKVNNKFFEDDFVHEHNLIITEGDKTFLIAGCAHRGIVNIKKRAEELIQKELDYVISGFHLFNPISKKYESDDFILSVAEKLNQSNTQYITCHCTGEKAFRLLKNVLADKLQYLATGAVLDL